MFRLLAKLLRWQREIKALSGGTGDAAKRRVRYRTNRDVGQKITNWINNL